MFLRLLAAALGGLLWGAALAAPAELSLPDAFARALAQHPELRALPLQQDQLDAARQAAALRAPLSVNLELENALGSGEARALRGSETTLSLAGVLERNDTRRARVAVIDAQRAALDAPFAVQRLDLLAEVARRYLTLIAANQHIAIAEADLGARAQTTQAAAQRHRAGALPQATVLSAEAAHSQAELTLARAQNEAIAARQFLAALWNERAPQWQARAQDAAGLLVLAEIDPLPALAAQLENLPDLARFASDARLAEARVQLAQSQAHSEVSWQLGARWRAETDDAALVAGVSLPLGSARRAALEQRQARADVALAQVQREAQQQALYATLAQAHGQYRSAQHDVRRLTTHVLPQLEQAAAAQVRAFAAGASTYLEVSQAQAEIINAQRQRLEAAVSAQRALIELQRLTGAPQLAAAGEQP